MAALAPVLRGSQAWLSRETETIHVITGALMGEVQAARGMSSKGSQHEVGQDAQRTQALNLLLVSTLWRVCGRTQVEELGVREKAGGKVTTFGTVAHSGIQEKARLGTPHPCHTQTVAGARDSEEGFGQSSETLTLVSG